MTKGFVCEAKDHEGDRLVRSLYDQYNLSVDAVRVDGKDRAFRIPAYLVTPELPSRICKPCVLKMEKRYRQGANDDQGVLGW